MVTGARYDGRSSTDMRQVQVQYGLFGYAPGNVLFSLGKTKVFCAVSMSSGVPPFMRGQQTGWLSAEYALLPTSTESRSTREIITMKRSGRSAEISRIIGRSLRAVIDLTVFGEKTIVVDCDVLQADGGTRTACITGAMLALEAAQSYWLKNRTITVPFLKDAVAAIAIAVVEGDVLIDPDYKEDMRATADFNFVMTKSGAVVEIQGGAEKEAISWPLFEQVAAVGRTAVCELFKNLEQYKKDAKSADPRLSISTTIHDRLHLG